MSQVPTSPQRAFERQDTSASSGHWSPSATTPRSLQGAAIPPPEVDIQLDATMVSESSASPFGSMRARRSDKMYRDLLAKRQEELDACKAHLSEALEEKDTLLAELSMSVASPRSQRKLLEGRTDNADLLPPSRLYALQHEEEMQRQQVAADFAIGLEGLHVGAVVEGQAMLKAQETTRVLEKRINTLTFQLRVTKAVETKALLMKHQKAVEKLNQQLALYKLAAEDGAESSPMLSHQLEECFSRMDHVAEGFSEYTRLCFAFFTQSVLPTLSAEVRSLQRQLEDARASSEEQLRDAREQSDRIRAELQTATARLSRTPEELQQEKQAREDEVAALGEKIVAAEREVAGKFTSQLEEKHSALRALQASKLSAQEELARTEAELRAKEEAANAFQLEATRERESLAGELSTVRVEQQRLITTLQAAARQQEVKYDAVCSELANMKARYTEATDTSADMLKEAAAEKDRMRNEMDRVVAQLATATRQLETDRQHHQDEVVSMAAKAADAERNTALKLASEVERRQSVVRELEALKSTAQQQVQQHEAETQERERAVLTMEEDARRERDAHAKDMRTTRAEHHTVLTALKAEKADLQRRCESLEHEVADGAEERRAADELRMRQLKDAQEQSDKIRNQLARATKDVSFTNEKLNVQRRKHAEHVAALQAKIVEVERTTCGKHATELEEKQSMLRELQASIAAAHQDLARSEVALRSKDQRVSEVTEVSRREKETLAEQLRAAREEQSHLLDMLQQREKALGEDVVQRDRTIATLHKELLAEAESRADAEREHHKVALELAVAREATAAAEANQAAAQQELESCVATCKAASESSVAAVSQELQQSKEEVLALQATCTDLETALIAAHDVAHDSVLAAVEGMEADSRRQLAAWGADAFEMLQHMHRITAQQLHDTQWVVQRQHHDAEVARAECTAEAERSRATVAAMQASFDASLRSVTTQLQRKEKEFKHNVQAVQRTAIAGEMRTLTELEAWSRAALMMAQSECIVVLHVAMEDTGLATEISRRKANVARLLHLQLDEVRGRGLVAEVQQRSWYDVLAQQAHDRHALFLHRFTRAAASVQSATRMVQRSLPADGLPVAPPQTPSPSRHHKGPSTVSFEANVVVAAHHSAAIDRVCAEEAAARTALVAAQCDAFSTFAACFRNTAATLGQMASQLLHHHTESMSELAAKESSVRSLEVTVHDLTQRLNRAHDVVSETKLSWEKSHETFSGDVASLRLALNESAVRNELLVRANNSVFQWGASLIEVSVGIAQSIQRQFVDARYDMAAAYWSCIATSHQTSTRCVDLVTAAHAAHRQAAERLRMSIAHTDARSIVSEQEATARFDLFCAWRRNHRGYRQASPLTSSPSGDGFVQERTLLQEQVRYQKCRNAFLSETLQGTGSPTGSYSEYLSPFAGPHSLNSAVRPSAPQ